MKVERIELIELKLELSSPFETSYSRIDDRRLLLVKLWLDGSVGWAECVADEAPHYASETVRTAWHVIEDFVAPIVFGRAYAHPREIISSLDILRGHLMAKAAVEMACWDAYSRGRHEPLSRSLGGSREQIASGVSIGMQDRLELLLEAIELELARGYQRIKIKIGPGRDVAVVAAIRERWPSVPLMVDANGAYTLADLPILQSLDAFDLLMIEQPLGHDDLWDHAKLQRHLRTPICLDESIQSPEDARKALEMGACRIINIKPGRVGGLARSQAVHDVAAAHGVPVWCGGMLETGIGRAHNVHLSSLPSFSLPGDVSETRRYFKTELIEPPLKVERDGTIRVPTGPGIGYRVLDDVVAKLALNAVTLEPS